MITKEQIEELTKDYQVDTFTIVREYLQLLFLSYLYQERDAGRIYFKGGTAIHLLFSSPRFSEDLDFSTSYSKERVKKIVRTVEHAMQKEMLRLQILLLYSGKKGIRFRIKYQPLDFKYPLVIRLDFNLVKRLHSTKVSPLISKFPIAIFPMVAHLSERQIFTEKISALFDRDKGRDLFDVWFLLEKGIAFDRKLLTGRLSKRIESYPQGKLNRDLTKFLPRSQRRIMPILKQKLKEKLMSVGNFGR